VVEGPSENRTRELQDQVRASEEGLRAAEAASGFGTFELQLDSGGWTWSPQVALLFGVNSEQAKRSFAAWEPVIFFDDVPKIRAALAGSRESGSFYVEFRVKHADGSLHWIAGKGQVAAQSQLLRGSFYEVTER
jgi:PAS domain-containing protein